MKKNIKTFTICACVSVISVLLGYTILAWSEPISMAPNGNVAAPVNTGDVSQTKAGGFNILGNLGIGAAAPVGNGKVCLNGQCCSTWKECAALGDCVFCVLKTCAGLGKNCGTIADDGCGGTLNCGNCAANQTCTNNVCVNNCVPQGCNGRCGAVSDGCGGTLDCGACYCPPVPASACDTNEQGDVCGARTNWCGSLIDCGGCPSGQYCSGMCVPCMIDKSCGGDGCLALGCVHPGGTYFWRCPCSNPTCLPPGC